MATRFIVTTALLALATSVSLGAHDTKSQRSLETSFDEPRWTQAAFRDADVPVARYWQWHREAAHGSVSARLQTESSFEASVPANAVAPSINANAGWGPISLRPAPISTPDGKQIYPRL
jgi:hypothetical protein